MTTTITRHDTIPSGLKGEWTLDIFDGDVERRALTPEQERENRIYADLGLPYPLHVGEIVSRPIEVIKGSNLIVTVGKQVIMDRLYGLSSVAAISRTGVGTSATAAAIGNTTLTGGVFKVFDSTPTRSSLSVTSLTTFGTSEANISWNEMALDNATTMLNRIAPIGPFAKSTAVSIGVTCVVTQA